MLALSFSTVLSDRNTGKANIIVNGDQSFM